MRNRTIRAALILMLAAPPAWSEFVPVFDASVLMGQVLFEGKSSAWQGNADISFTPAWKLGESWALIPTYAGSYRATKNVVELAGGGQLFQDSQGHSLSLKSIHRFGPIRVKPSIGYRWELLRETTEEKVGGGLFDYRKPSAGLEGEWVIGDDQRLSLGYDYYRIFFPNYRTLESNLVASGLGREQSDGRTLDTDNHSWTVTGQTPLPVPGVNAAVSLNYTDRYHPYQKLVTGSGELARDLRSDILKSVSARFWWGKAFTANAAAVVAFTVGHTRYESNQGHFDPQLNVYASDYYSYEERLLSPKLTLVLGERKGEFSVAYLLVSRGYLGRPAQDKAGGVNGEAVTLDQDSFLFDLAVPVGWGFKVRAQSALTNASSNMKYEKTFRYNYAISNHLFGFSYSY